MATTKKWLDERMRLRIIIILALLIGYLIVAVLRSGTAWR